MLIKQFQFTFELLLVTSLNFFLIVHAVDSDTEKDAPGSIWPNFDGVRSSKDANLPNPNLKDLSDHGKHIEKGLNHEVTLRHLGKHSVAEFRPRRMQKANYRAEQERNLAHKKENEMIENPSKWKKSYSTGLFSSLTPRGRATMDAHFDRDLSETRGKKAFARQRMRNIRNDAKVHLKNGNFNEHDYKFVTQTNFKESHDLGYLSNGRHISSPNHSRSQSPSSPRSPSSSPSRSRSRSPPQTRSPAVPQKLHLVLHQNCPETALAIHLLHVIVLDLHLKHDLLVHPKLRLVLELNCPETDLAIHVLSFATLLLTSLSLLFMFFSSDSYSHLSFITDRCN